MNTYISYLFKFLFRIKWWLILAPLVVALLVYVKMGAMSRTYKSTTTIFTGLVSGYDLESSSNTSSDWNVINNAMDNLISIIQSQATLKNVSMRLYAQNMVHGDPKEDNNYILSSHYNREVAHTPKHILELIDRSSEENTLRKLSDFEEATHDNHIYGLFHWTHRYYSYDALRNIQVKRIGNSDMLEISYENNDPGIVYNTLVLLNDEFVKQYKDLRFGETNNVIAFFEAELNRVGSQLHMQEDSLRDFNVANLVINYEEQTKHIAILSRDFELRNEELRMSYNSAEKLKAAIEEKIGDLRSFRNNAAFIEKLHTIGNLQSQLTTAEVFNTDGALTDKPKAPIAPERIDNLRSEIKGQTDSLRRITSAISLQSYTKEGISTPALVQQWLDAVLLSTKSQAELSIMTDWQQSLDERYERYAPVGAVLKRKNREIGFSEQSYLSILQALNSARLKQKNLQMSSATLRIINPPVIPIAAEPTKRKIMVAAAFASTLIFILGFFMLLELLDRTLRDKIRAERITGGHIIGAFPGPGRLSERRFSTQYRQIAARSIGSAAINYFNPAAHTNTINILSTAAGDGKSFFTEHLAAYFREVGMKVRVVSWNTDFDAEQKNFLLASRLEDFVSDAKGQLPFAEADIILVEYPPLDNSSVPKQVLKQAVLNIVIAPANRTWKETDQLLYQKIVKLSEETATAICLNCASRDVVQTFTGLLPPFSRLRKLSYQIGQFGFTAVK